MQFADTRLDVAAQTFGRDAAMFQDLLSFMASFSMALWVLVLVTAVVRFVACRLLYRRPPFQPVQEQRANQNET